MFVLGTQGFMKGCGREREGATLNFEREKEEPRPPLSALSLSLCSKGGPGEKARGEAAGGFRRKKEGSRSAGPPRNNRRTPRSQQAREHVRLG